MSRRTPHLSYLSWTFLTRRSRKTAGLTLMTDPLALHPMTHDRWSLVRPHTRARKRNKHFPLSYVSSVMPG